MPVDLTQLADDQMLDDEEALPPEEGEVEEPAADFTALVEALTKFSGDMEAAQNEMDSDLLKDTNLDMRTTDELILRQGFEELDDELKMALRDSGELNVSDCMRISATLFDEEVVEDPYQCAGWLCRISRVAQGYMSDEEAEAPDEEELDDEDDDEEDDDFGDEEELDDEDDFDDAMV